MFVTYISSIFLLSIDSQSCLVRQVVGSILTKNSYNLKKVQMRHGKFIITKILLGQTSSTIKKSLDTFAVEGTLFR